MSNQDKCIYCGASGPFADEHAIPRSLGKFKNFPLLKNRICNTCNNVILGECEQQIGRSGPEALFKKYLGIEGRKSHDNVNSFLRGSAGAKPIDFLAPLPENPDVQILWEINPEGRTLKEVKQVVIIDKKTGKSYPIRIPDWMTKPEQLREEIHKRGFQGKKFDLMAFADGDEIEQLKQLLPNASSKIDWVTPQASEVSNPRARFHVTDKYFRAVAKVGFHYFLTVIDEFKGNEPYFTGIRNYIFKGEKKSNVFAEDSDSIINIPHPDIRPKMWSHVLLVETRNNHFQVKLQFFLGPPYDPPTYVVRISDDIRVELPKVHKGHMFIYYNDGLKEGFNGEVVDIEKAMSPNLIVLV